MKDFNTVLYQNIGLKIKEARKKLNLSQEQLSKKVEISRASISNIELGRHYPPLHLLYNIAHILHLDIQLLLPTMHEIQEGISSDILSDILNNEDIKEDSKTRIKNIIKDLSI